VTYAKERWGDRIALLGGIDMDVLARRNTGEVRAYVRMILEKCAEGDSPWERATQ